MLTSKGIITPLQEDVIRSFAGLPDSDLFYLTKGTALSDFYLAHRKSFDLDIFITEENLVLPFSRLFERRLEKSFQLEVIRRHATFAEFQVGTEGGETRVRLAYDSPRRLRSPRISIWGSRLTITGTWPSTSCSLSAGGRSPGTPWIFFYPQRDGNLGHRRRCQGEGPGVRSLPAGGGPGEDRGLPC